MMKMPKMGSMPCTSCYFRCRTCMHHIAAPNSVSGNSGNSNPALYQLATSEGLAAAFVAMISIGSLVKVITRLACSG